MTTALRMLVLGHSDSDGTRLADPADSWPQVVAREMPAVAGLSIELTHRILFPGGRALARVESALATSTPDIVAVAPFSYSASFEFVSVRLREALGERMARMILPAERVAARWSSSAARVHAAAVVPRRVARRVIGTRPNLSVAAALQSYAEVFQRLAREEEIQVIVVSSAGFSLYHERMNPRMKAITARFAVEHRRAAEEHRFDWLAFDELLGGRGAKEPYFLTDGVHTDEAGQRLVADAVIPLIVRRWGDS